MRSIDQTRQEIRDLAQAEPTPQALALLRQRVERSSNELNGQHWAFNLDGGLLWNISDVRKDLIVRGSGVGNALQRSIDTLSRTAEWASDSSLDSEILGRLRSATLDELTMQTLPASDQITDRRDFQSHILKFMRGFQNPISLSDRPEVLPHLIPLGCSRW